MVCRFSSNLLIQKTLFFFSSVNVICTSLKFKLSCFLFYIKELEQSIIIIIILGMVCFQAAVRKTVKPPFIKTRYARNLSQPDF